MQKSAQDVLKDIKQLKLAPIYLIHGDEPFFIDQLVDAFENKVLSPDQQSFNQFVMYGKDQSLGEVISYARRFPMMSDKQVIIVKEAVFLEAMAKGKTDAKDKGNTDWKAWVDYCERPTESTILVFTLKTLLTDKSKILAPLDKKGVVVASKKISEDRLGVWLKDYLGSHALHIQANAQELMVSFVGTDLKRMAHEADKLIVNVPQGKEIGLDEVEKFIGISREYNYFEFQKAIIQRNGEKGQKIAFYFAENTKQNPAAPMLIMLFNFFAKVLQVHDLGSISDGEMASAIGVNPYYVKDYTLAKRNYPIGKVVRIIEAIKNADLRVKGVMGNSDKEREIILDLSFEIFNL
ncbi:DNA polymerase III subunit delta [Aquirufa aurantiipilula]|uniref:DNA polymerase III subunit delta n=1 Tax=Aquirufa aurantiipilula TaxID=2696561 RepID=A0ABT6BL73_9BACT|nr:DNA polymerase III subunit delta [Aquirufa aurantiipilula]MDF5691235.1 DNA polymerase III subunit delta [Aquirufa aurantiipilula]